VRLPLPGDALVVLIGISGSGKSTLAARHFDPSDILSSDAFRAIVSGDEADQGATEDAFSLLHAALEMRLRRARLTVVDATNVEGWARRALLAIADRFGRPAVAIVLEVPPATAMARIAARTARRVPAPAMRRQQLVLERSIDRLADEGFAAVYRLDESAIEDTAFDRRDAPG
jgi:protein phosphatase